MCQFGLRVVQFSHPRWNVLEGMSAYAVPQPGGKLDHLAVNLLLGGCDMLLGRLVQFGDDHPGEEPVQLVVFGKLVGLAPDADAGLVP